MASNVLMIVGLVFCVGITAVTGCAGEPPSQAAVQPGAMEDAEFRGFVFDTSGKLAGPVAVPKVKKTDTEWREQLTAEQFRIVREAGTERAGAGALLKNKADGVYGCVACGLPLFTSKTKFESGTGWPSFYQAIGDGNVDEVVDRTLGMTRVEIRCARCDGHLGHVFDDGPRPTGLRYCVNSESLAFTPKEKIVTLADPAASQPKLATVVLAGGCFWCVEAVFEELDGVTEAVSGYAGDTRETADYKAVSAGKTKHAEAVQIVYDPSKIAYEDLLRVHFATHDPTQLNRQGNDFGPQYRSAIFFANDEERAVAQAFIEDLNDQKVYRKTIVTTLEPLTEFYPAESYHQNYVCNNPNAGYVRSVALPKVDKVRKEFKDRLKAESPLKK